jgi:acyl carrier protein
MNTLVSPDELATVISQVAGVPVSAAQLTDEQVTLDDLGVDSLGALGILNELARRSGRRLDDNDVDLTLSPPALLAWANARPIVEV